MTKKEREFLRLLLWQDAQVKKLYSETVTSLAGYLNHFRVPENGIINTENLWVRNKAIEASIDKKLNEFQERFTGLLTESRAEALEISKQYSDQVINSYLSRLPISKIAKEGIYARSMEAFTAFEKKGLNVSSRVWKTTQVMKDQLAFYGASGVASGQPAARIATDLKDFLQHPDKRFRRIRDKETGKLKLSQPAKDFHPGRGVYRSSYQNALRLAQTETNMAFRQADQARWQGMPFILGYEVKLSAQHPEYDICDEMQGRYPKNFVFGGWHPKCICYTVPIMADEDDFIDYLTGEELQGKLIDDIPSRASKYIQKMSPTFKGYKNKPYFLKDNFTFQKGEYQLRKSVQKVKVIPSKELLKNS